MSDLMKVGDFARFCGTTIDTLLHYDRMGLLKPAEVAPNGYRYYAASQINRFISVKALSDAGFSLADAAALLDARDLDALADAIEGGRVALRARIAELDSSLARLGELERQAARARSLHFGEVEEVELGRLFRLNVETSKRGTVVEYASDPSVVEADNAALVKLRDASPEAGLAPYGMLSSGPMEDGPVVYEGMFYLVPDERTAQRLKRETTLSQIPAGRYARVAFEGPWDNISPAHHQLVDYVSAHGGDPNAPRYEVSAFRLFDSSSEHGFDTYTCTVFMQLA